MGDMMKRLAGLTVAALLTLTGCGAASTTAAAPAATVPSAAMPAATAAPAATPGPSATQAAPGPAAPATVAPMTATPAPSRSLAYQPSFRRPDEDMDLKVLDDPMVQYQEKKVTPEESAWRQNVLYKAFPEMLNEGSLNYASAQDWANDMYSRGLITSKARDDAFYNGLDQILRTNGFGRQVQALYCPLHEQNASVFDLGATTCHFKAYYDNAKDGAWLYPLAFDNMVGMAFYNDYFDTGYEVSARVTLVKEDGTWKVDKIKVNPACLSNSCSTTDNPAH